MLNATLQQVWCMPENINNKIEKQLQITDHGAIDDYAKALCQEASG